MSDNGAVMVLVCIFCPSCVPTFLCGDAPVTHMCTR